MQRYYQKHLRKENGVTISAEVKEEVKEYQAEKLLVSVGRKANIEGIGLENTEIQVEKGFIRDQ